MNQHINVAIDGPAGAGKSTVAKLVAKNLSYIYIDTGAMYRALTYCALDRDVDLEDESTLSDLLDKIDITLTASEGETNVLVNQKDVTNDIRTAEVTNAVSVVSSHKRVREEMVRRQQKLAQGGGTVLDGRDIGTHVLPDAEVKVFLTASVSERAKRRHQENLAKGYPSNLDQLMEEIKLRDERDSNREFAPLKKATDAVEIDSTSLTIDEVVDSILNLVKERN
ncbi:(d)CMP kinase [Desertibacillus haloalkaliphilus]|uniref:(d)CMP kinase n=1 Tax=Desertibacillus haloalkaliphilus TaxID=1328930 RepID=UPI001C26347E|nr:(d)CMP kinase [Desertibacillus haloalkaliphilus]MBU8907223.1 (d)CMP kinase [Desertibacillus haloalkaliphilus]